MIAAARLMAAGVQPEDENGKPLARANLQSPSGARIIWLPRRFGRFSIIELWPHWWGAFNHVRGEDDCYFRRISRVFLLNCSADSKVGRKNHVERSHENN